MGYFQVLKLIGNSDGPLWCRLISRDYRKNKKSTERGPGSRTRPLRVAPRKAQELTTMVPTPGTGPHPCPLLSQARHCSQAGGLEALKP